MIPRPRALLPLLLLAPESALASPPCAAGALYEATDTAAKKGLDAALETLSNDPSAPCAQVRLARSAPCSTPATAPAEIRSESSGAELWSGTASCKASAPGSEWRLELDRALLTQLGANKAVFQLILPKVGTTGESRLQARFTPPAARGATRTATTAATAPSTSTASIDLVPIPAPRALADRLCTADREDGLRYLCIDENLAVRGASDPHVTESDRVVVRFIARKAVACRMFAQTSTSNTYAPRTFRIGGEEGLATFREAFDLVGLREGEEAPRTSCGYPLSPSGAEGLATVTGEGAEYTTTDFTFGPYTKDELVFHLSRKNRLFTGVDLMSDLKVANHLRYAGWFEVLVLGAAFTKPTDALSIIRQPGSELRRLHVDPQHAFIDVAIGLKWLALCSGDANPAWAPVDIRAATVCLGLGTAISVTHPSERFYPLGANLTFGGFFSASVMIALDRRKAVSAGFVDGMLFDGEVEDVAVEERPRVGVAFAVGVDPALFGAMVKGLVVGR
ncbi:MAG: hypothetical protein IT384_03440 [Deltaproteobacteria bacterium]|nr:hypothetical protein [Deltaproteobacteria bacterium]